MKTFFLAVFLGLMINPIAYSQTNFEPGYFIDNHGTKHSGFIKNKDWSINPTEFQFKENESSKATVLTIREVNEFSITNRVKYQRATVEIDKSILRADKLTYDKYPRYITETLFLKVLQEGAASLYEYKTNSLIKYFIQPDSVSKMEQLFFKEYYLEDGRVAQNNAYKQQLKNHLTCGEIREDNFRDLRYESKELIRVVSIYNQCVSPELSETKNHNKAPKDLFRIKIKGGYTYSILRYEYPDGLAYLSNVTFKNASGYNIGGEVELILPFNNNKWSILLSPVFQSMKGSYFSNDEISHFDIHYQSIEFPMGVRYYSYLSENTSLYLDASYVITHKLDGEINVERDNRTTEYDITASGNLLAGLGVGYHDRLNVEIKYGFNRELLNYYQNHSLLYSTISINLAIKVY